MTETLIERESGALEQLEKGLQHACLALLILASCGKNPQSDQSSSDKSQAQQAAVGKSTDSPIGSPPKSPAQAEDLAAVTQVRFSGADITPSPACLAVAPTGEVFVGVDQIGSLGKEEGRGRIVRLTDTDADGVADEHTEFAKVNNPRGLLPIGHQLFVLHTTFSEETGKASGMQLVVFEDIAGDGIADGPPTLLLQNISTRKFVADRGTDHATNGIRMGIDGWIYIAVGDFGFHNAVDAADNHMTLLGGGILRVRPDGTETEMYTLGMRNIYDVAIDPYMNIFTRGNTNDGGGWNVRFVHHIQSARYGYPMLFKHFTEEILPALVDIGGGSGTGAFFLQDPRWPASLNHVPIMADWGRSQLFIHRVTPDGASFQQAEEPFLRVRQVTDLDVDGSGRMYLSAWDDAGYSGSSEKGYVSRAVPKGWTWEPYEPSASLDLGELGERLRSESAVARLDASQELMRRPKEEAAEVALEVAQSKAAPLHARVAGIFTFAQIKGASAIDDLVALSNDGLVREFTLRALADRATSRLVVPVEPFIRGLRDPSERVQAAAAIGLGRLQYNQAGIQALLSISIPASFVAPIGETEGPHARPNSGIILPHLAVQALVAQEAAGEAIRFLKQVHLDADAPPQLALWVLRYLHTDEVVDALIETLRKAESGNAKRTQYALLESLARLYHQEADYDGSWWWNTRPDTHGPYYRPVPWKATSRIEEALVRTWNMAKGPALVTMRARLRALNTKHRLNIDLFATPPEPAEEQAAAVDLAAIQNRSGEIGKAAIEDIFLALGTLVPDVEHGKKLFEAQGCTACHTLTPEEAPKGPFMGQVGAIMTREAIAESILRPNASISQGFASVAIEMKDGSTHAGFVTAESSVKVDLRDITGQVTELATANILSREELPVSMMPPGLANALSLQEFASLVGFLAQQK